MRLEIGDVVLVRTGTGTGHAQDADGVRDLTPDEHERLRREQACNPLLWSPRILMERLAQAELLGGAMVFGHRAFRLAVPGEGECETWLDGATGVGFAFRDPVRRARVECQVLPGRMLVVVDGKFEPGWSSVDHRFRPADEALFRRP
jgi:hypothetical protein